MADEPFPEYTECLHPQRQNRKMRSLDGAFDGWLTWCPRCHVAWDNTRIWFHDDALPWPYQLVAYTGQIRGGP